MPRGEPEQRNCGVVRLNFFNYTFGIAAPKSLGAREMRKVLIMRLSRRDGQIKMSLVGLPSRHRDVMETSKSRVAFNQSSSLSAKLKLKNFSSRSAHHSAKATLIFPFRGTSRLACISSVEAVARTRSFGSRLCHCFAAFVGFSARRITDVFLFIQSALSRLQFLLRHGVLFFSPLHLCTSRANI